MTDAEFERMMQEKHVRWRRHMLIAYGATVSALAALSAFFATEVVLQFNTWRGFVAGMMLGSSVVGTRFTWVLRRELLAAETWRQLIRGGVKRWGPTTYGEDSRLYEAARRTCHDFGLPWRDPRTGIEYPPPRETKH